MRQHIKILFLLFAFSPCFGQTYQLTVQNGYGSGQYAAGDTVHIWAAEYPNSEVFWRWTGQVEHLLQWDAREDDWHKRVVMPAKNVTVRANTKTMPPNSDLAYEEIMGRDTLKRVFSYFPAKPKGTVWFFHGTGGEAYAWVNPYDNRQLVNRCIADTFAIIITECEESTKEKDLDNDGNFKRWNYTPDSVANVDFANIRAIRDTFIRRGKIGISTPNIGVGFSAGGAMSLIMGWYSKWKVGVDYGTGGVPGAAQNSTAPAMICPNRRDDHPEVGPEGVNEAFVHQQLYRARGVCSEVYVNEPGPLHPQRFKRKPGITAAQSLAIFNDLMNNNCLGPKGYLLKSLHQIEDLVAANPQKWPSLATLGIPERLFVGDQIAELWTSHHFTPDFDGKALRFIQDACGSGVTAAPEAVETARTLRIWPNPATYQITVEGVNGLVRIFAVTGQLQMVVTGPTVDISALAPGLYYVQTALGVGKLVRE